MGCCESQNPNLRKETLISYLKQAIQENDLQKFKFYLHKRPLGTEETLDINYCIFKAHNNIGLNLPCLCVLEGRLNHYKYIHKRFTILIQNTENILGLYKLSALSILCAKGYSDFLEFYLPLALSINVKNNELADSIRICFNEDDSFDDHPIGLSPIQLACFYGNINCIKVVKDYFKDSPAPWWLDIHYQDPQSGANGALISCESGNYSTIKFLYAIGCDFHRLNNRNENALQIFLIACKRHKICDKLSIFKYLVETVKVNLLYEVEETLIVCVFPEIICYIEQVLFKLGTGVRKRELDAKNDLQFSKESEGIDVGQGIVSSGFLDELGVSLDLNCRQEGLQGDG